MKDFQYGNERASDYGLIHCYFDSSEAIVTMEGAEINSDTIHLSGTDEFVQVTSSYSSTLSFSFQLMKIDEQCNPLGMSTDEFSKIERWLRRKESHRLRVIQDGYEDKYYIGRFNVVNALKINDVIYGVDVTFVSDFPYGFMDEVTIRNKGKSITVFNISDEVGDIYPDVKIECLEDGDLEIRNSMDDEIFVFKGCKQGEVLEISNKNKLIQSTVDTHMLYDDFNYNYLKLVNTYDENKNVFTSSLNIDITFKYSPVRKVGI